MLPPIPHRQYVCTIPKMLRVYFRNDRRLLGTLSQCAYACVKAFFQATLKKPQAVPGVIVAIQTFGEMANFHPHLHAIVSDGLFAANGWLSVVPDIDVKKLERLFRHKVFTLLRREGKIDDALIKMLVGWRHSGFSIHYQVGIGSQDQPRREKLAQYILRAPFSQEKMRYHASTLCARCGGAMRIIAFIHQREVIEEILTHLRLWPSPSHAPPPSAVA